MDGTLSSLMAGQETNAGLTFQLCKEVEEEADLLVRYDAGIQWYSWRDTIGVLEGRGINRMVSEAYGALASRYRKGDKIYLFGYSRGAYAVRSLAGWIDRLGLVRHDAATARVIRQGFRHYQYDPHSEQARAFRDQYTHGAVPIEMIGAWDTVAALGIRLPVLWRFSSVFHKFYDSYPPLCVKHCYHALAMDESREAYAPVMFNSNPDHPTQVVEQMWFRGTHSDIGGQLPADFDGRALANTVWMLEKAEGCGLALPKGWQGRYPFNPKGKSRGKYRGWSKLFLNRKTRVIGDDPSEVQYTESA